MTAQFSQSARVAYLQLEAAYQRALVATTVADLDTHAAAMKEAGEHARERPRRRAQAGAPSEERSAGGAGDVRASSRPRRRARPPSTPPRPACRGAARRALRLPSRSAGAISGTLETISDLAADTGFQLREKGKATALHTFRVGYAALGFSVLIHRARVPAALPGRGASDPALRRLPDVLAAGDLTRQAETTGRDEISAMAVRYNEVVATMRDTLRQVRTSSDGVADSAQLAPRRHRRAGAPVAESGRRARGDGGHARGDHRRREAQRRERRAGQQARRGFSRGRGARRAGRHRGGGGDGRVLHVLAPHRRHHRQHRRDRVPDEPARAQRGRGGRARGRTGSGLRGGGRGGPQPRAARSRVGEGDQDADPGLGGQGAGRVRAGEPLSRRAPRRSWRACSA